MSKKFSIALGLASLALAIFLVGCSYHHDYDRYPGYGYGYGSSGYSSRGAEQAYRSGYQRGYDHGNYDRRYGSHYDYRDDDVYRSGISRDGYINDQFRSGYVRGYQDGFYGKRGY